MKKKKWSSKIRLYKSDIVEYGFEIESIHEFINKGQLSE